MRLAVCIRCLGLAVGILLATGCRSSAPGRPAAGPRAAPPSPRAEMDEAAAQLAEAHAHYAMGVIHEINEKPEAALQEYYQAALDDPSNERLIQEVSRRFIQNKEPEKALELLKRAAASPQATG